MITRALEQGIFKNIGKNKVILLFGTRRVGKTVLVGRIGKRYGLPFLFLNGEDHEVQALLENRSAANYGRILGDSRLLIVDEAQAIPEIGKVLKLFIDTFKELTIIATGSSSFDLINKAGEPLTGRSITFNLYPVAQLELNENLLQTVQFREERLIFGSYPELFGLKTLEEKQNYLAELTRAYLLKDILTYEQVKNSSKLFDLLRLIAFQIGSEVSLDELARQIGLSKNTVERYLDLLVKVFIIYKVGGFSNNLRKEVTKSSKWYFYDNGIRNAVINNFRLAPLRNDMGALWENYCMAERLKKQSYAQKTAEIFFWRTYDQQEIDLIEKQGPDLLAVDFKWGDRHKKIPVFFKKNYPQVPFTVINPDNYLDFIT